MKRKEALKKMVLGVSGAFALPAKPMETHSIKQESDRAAHWQKAALVIVDMQNDFVRRGAPLEVPDARKTIENHLSLISAFKKRSLPVIYTKFISHSHYYLLWDWSPQCQPPTKCCWKGHQRQYPDINATRECTEIIDEIRPAPEDIIIEKHGYGAFHGTSLDSIIRSFGLNAVVITGTVTQICVEETAREAFHYGFRATLVEDAISSFAPDLHAATIKNFAMKFGWVDRTQAIVSALV